MDLAFAPRGQVQLASAVVPQDLPEIGLKGGVLEVIAKPPGGGMGAPQENLPTTQRGARGCGCQSGDAAGGLALLGLVGLVGLVWRRKRG
jgi:MYXO-CTERM domain-containing protein